MLGFVYCYGPLAPICKCVDFGNGFIAWRVRLRNLDMTHSRGQKRRNNRLFSCLRLQRVAFKTIMPEVCLVGVI